jgi:hypothetical protein
MSDYCEECGQVEWLCICKADKDTKEYDYNVIFTGNYWSLTTRISIDLDDTANEAIREELGIDPINFAHSTNVALLLDDEEIWLEGLGEFPPVHVSTIEGEGE